MPALLDSPHLPLPHRVSLVTLTVQSLRAAIAAGRWHGSMPGERELCANLRVSRPTLRAALAELQREGTVSAAPRAGRTIRRAPAARYAESSVVGVISRTPLQQMSPTALLLVDSLREQLGQSGRAMQFHTSPATFSSAPERALKSLVARTPRATWLLLTSVRPMQEWFVRQRLRCLVIGTCMDDIPLPWVDADHFATARHAGVMVLRKGHRRIALVCSDEGTGGDHVSEEGLQRVLAPHAGASLNVLRHHGRDHLLTLLDRGITSSAPPTAYFVLRAPTALLVTMHLLRRGVRVPQDAVVISRDDESFLEQTSPIIARYSVNPHHFARKITHLIESTPDAPTLAPRAVRLMPRFIAGETI